MNTIYHSPALDVLGGLSDESIDLVYVDPPFGTGQRQSMSRKKDGHVVSQISYEDPDDNYIEWLKKHVVQFRRVLKQSGSLYLHLDHHWVHRVKVMLDDEVFGSDCFLNEIIWSYDFGGRGKRCWPKKHDNILVYVKEHDKHVFNWDAIPRVAYKAPDMQRVGRTPEDAAARIALGKVPTDVWDLSIVGTNSKERNGYPTQKPKQLIERVILASSPPGGLVLDVFAGSGTTGEAAYVHGRNFILSDISENSIAVMKKRFKDVTIDWR